MAEAKKILAYELNLIANCSICGDPLLNFDDKGGLLETPCRHLYHKDCLVEWLSDGYPGGNCPLCREKVAYSEENSSVEEGGAVGGNPPASVEAANSSNPPPAPDDGSSSSGPTPEPANPPIDAHESDLAADDPSFEYESDESTPPPSPVFLSAEDIAFLLSSP